MTTEKVDAADTKILRRLFDASMHTGVHEKVLAEQVKSRPVGYWIKYGLFEVSSDGRQFGRTLQMTEKAVKAVWAKRNPDAVWQSVQEHRA